MRVLMRRALEPPTRSIDEILDGAQQLRLCRRGEIGDLVEEQRAFMRVLELAAAAANAGGRALLDAEQLRLEQCLDDRRAVDRDEGAAPAATELVHLARDQFLPASAFPFDEHREIGGGHAFDPLADPADRLARTYQRRRAVDRPVQRRPELPSSNGAFELQHHGGELRGGLDQLTRPVVERPRLVEDDFEAGLAVAWRCRHVEADGIGRRGHGLGAVVAQPHRSRLQRTSQFFLQPFARRAWFGEGKAGGDRSRQRGDTAPAVGPPAQRGKDRRRHERWVPSEHPTSWSV